jgi:hypothetical protein
MRLLAISGQVNSSTVFAIARILSLFGFSKASSASISTCTLCQSDFAQCFVLWFYARLRLGTL